MDCIQMFIKLLCRIPKSHIVIYRRSPSGPVARARIEPLAPSEGLLRPPPPLDDDARGLGPSGLARARRDCAAGAPSRLAQCWRDHFRAAAPHDPPPRNTPPPGPKQAAGPARADYSGCWPELRPEW
eukprot:scaffold2462_cov402-Prasinococcus_capsulatus_cf.AAC.31